MLDTLDIALARQPIFDREDRLVAYELLYRDRPPENRVVGVAGTTPARMTSDTIAGTFLGMGLGRVTGGKRAFVNVDRAMLLGGSVGVMDPRHVVLELLETVACDAETLAACEALVARGYTLALDDYVDDASYDPFLRLAAIVKVDVLGRDDAALRPLLARLRGFGVHCLAERVESAEVHARCVRLGFDLFQGYFYARPEMLAGREVPVQQANLVRLLNLVRDADAEDEAIEAVFRGDVSLTYRLLRIVNSAALGHAGVRSIGQAIRLLGRVALHRWIGLLLVSSFATPNGVRSELVTTAIVRARHGELLAGALGRRREGSALFMAGLFSLLDALMGMPMSDVVDRLDLAPELREALLSRGGPLGPALRLVEAFEGARWDEVSAHVAPLGADPAEVLETYLQAVEWAREHAAAAGA